MSLSKKELKKLRDNLPTGSYDKIAQNTGYTERTVRSILFYPDRYNQKVIAEALSIIEKIQQDIAAQKEAIKNIK